MRLFTALWPTAAVVDHLAARLPDRWPAGVRPTPASRWHLTLCFHGDADPGMLARQLEQRAAGCVAPACGWPAPGSCRGLPSPGCSAPNPPTTPRSGLVAAAGGNPAGFLPHVTVARARRGRAWPTSTGPLHRHRGPWWQPGEVHLVSSEQAPGPVRYRVQHRVPLLTAAPGRSASAAGW